MQQFIVPQFIDVEDKIIGPITTRQFIVMLAGFLLVAIYYKIFDFSLFVTLGLLTLLITGIFAFLKINGRPFHYFVLNLFQTLKRTRLRVWRNDSSSSGDDYGVKENNFSPAIQEAAVNKHYTASRLAELSLIVDTRGAYQGENEDTSVKSVER
ncbi:PrgI family protein [Candidatus Falkowbacteria bacterium]|nr:PrgI family protein [Candidatus Falkowbacteria bacterium]